MEATLKPIQTAPLGGTMTFECTVKYSHDAPSSAGESGAELSVTVSSGLTFLDSSWTLKEQRDGYRVYTIPITFQANVPRTFRFQVRLDQPGTQTVMAGARVFLGDNGDQVGEGATKFLDVSANGTTVRDQPQS